MTAESATSPAAMPVPGQPAPDFELSDDEGRTRRLSDERGRWMVLYFYPKDDTPGCTAEACTFRDANDEILARDAQVLGVSVRDSASKAAFKRKYNLPFSLLADEEHLVAERYGVWLEKENHGNHGKRYMGIQRATFLVDPQGVVRRVWPTVKPEQHAAEVLAALDEERRAAESVAPRGASN